MSESILLTNLWEMPGGIHPPENKQQSLNTNIANAPLPQQVVIPLNMHIGAPAVPLVTVGDLVLHGQMIACASGDFSCSVHSSVSGTVTHIEPRPIAHVSGMHATCIVIKSDGLDKTMNMQPIADYRQETPAVLIKRIVDSGIAGMGGAGFPTAIKIAPRAAIDTLIINATECEPYITADHALLREYAEDIIQGALLLAHILSNPKRIIIGLEDNKKDVLSTLQEAISQQQEYDIEIGLFPTKYPSGGEKQLIQILTGLEVPAGKLPADIGIVLQNIGTCVAAWNAVSKGEPLTTRITTFVGEALSTHLNLKTRIGAPISQLLNHCGYDQDKSERVIVGGPMMGFSLLDSNAGITKTINCILAPTAKELPDPPAVMACIRCGQCAEACPVSLLPQQLYWHAKSDDFDKLQDHNLFDCIECGACSYVCPSHIPLVQYYRYAKGSIRNAAEEKKKSDHSRERFEARQRRIDNELKQREFKREKRMAAAKAKQLKAASKKANEPEPSKSDDLLAQAMARVTLAKANPKSEQATLTRQKTTFEARITGIEAKIEATATDEIKSKLHAQLMNTQKQLKDIKAKLATLNRQFKPSQSETPSKEDS